ncbi:uncharacterized protein LOC127730466 isoform X2 [Mytilus californianus]|uniref:uncharacterized protein LOC127730466 isoform X2 n=1 Tax=Mytilus californianus TaxID=6549 RepID=UPI002247E09C|nr:uncharacterized protein LOC127730466 isoform X2 [Mytilus californianus]
MTWILKIILILSLLYLSTQQIPDWNGYVCSETLEKINVTTICNETLFLFCVNYINITETYNETEYFCCTGWTHNGDQNCSIPVCSSVCQNGGSCINPDTCHCAAGYEGSTCQSISLCSHLSPCFPGDCSGDPKQCVCRNGFSGTTCLNFDNSYTPVLHSTNSTLSYVNSTTNMVQYSYTVTSMTSNRETWSNQQDYNVLVLSIDAIFDTNSTIGFIPTFPNYVSDTTFGIVTGQVIFTYTFTTGGSTSFSRDCSGLSSTSPVDDLQCIIPIAAPFTVSSGDTFTLTFDVTSGGNRRLKNTDNNSITETESYSGHSVQEVLEFRFDFEVPVHCIQSSSCTDTPLQMADDTTMTTIRPYWSGWNDTISGVYRYVFEVWKMEYVPGQDGLREPLITSTINPEPSFITEIMADSITFPEYTPSEPGVYSCILEVNDKANNSIYARRIVVFDDTSDINVNTSKRLYISTASTETDYMWQTEYNVDGVTDIDVVWTDLFSNHLHDKEYFLSKILAYEARLSDKINRHDYKKILTEFDDNEGDRTLNATSHLRGIIKFEISHEIISKPKSVPPDFGWSEISPLSETTSFQMTTRTIGDGDSHQVWIRATDVTGRNNTITTTIHFDKTGPLIHLSNVAYNINGGSQQFTSRITVISQDFHSGVLNASFEIVLNETGEVKFRTDVIVNNETTEDCAKTADCYCVPMGQCFTRTMTFDFDNCLLAVPLELIDSGAYLLHVTSYNTAKLPSLSVIQIGDVGQFNGVNKYPSPSSISVINKTNTEITIQWTNSVTCYQIAQFILYLHRPDNTTDSFMIDKDSVIYTITDLSPGASYDIEMYTEYGNGTNLNRSLEPLTTIFSTAQYCSHLQPCFPGVCNSYNDECACSDGFLGNNCLQFGAQYMPSIHRTNSSISFYDSTAVKDLFTYSTDSTGDRITWSNQEDFNVLKFTLEASFHSDSVFGPLPGYPNYVTNVTFGIVEGRVHFNHSTINSGNNDTILKCAHASNMKPVDDLQCNFNVDKQLKLTSGDTLILEFVARSGGKLELMKIDDGTVTGVEFYNGATTIDVLEFKFDFGVPIHCTETSTCSYHAMQLQNDITSIEIRPYWLGWTDYLSGISSYTFEVWKMEYNADAEGLQEPLITNNTNPSPLLITNILGNNLTYPTYKPTEPGVYSCILEVNDVANNSEYVRRIVIFDDISDVTVNSSHRLFVSSANIETNYSWQTDFKPNAKNDITVIWEGLFSNSLHHQEHILAKVLDYNPRLSDNIRRHNYKRILTNYDDHEGDRTVESISNINGIVKFQINHEIVSRPSSEAPGDGWEDIYPLAEHSVLDVAAGTIGDGDSQQIWVRALDVFGRNKTQTTVIHFDQSGPDNFLTNVVYNTEGGAHTFSSRITFVSQDLHSGVTNVSIQVVLNGTDSVKFEENVYVEEKTTESCALTHDCYCVPMGLCFMRSITIEINNCHLSVPIDMIENGYYHINITSHNTASLDTSTFIEIGDVSKFNGINSYPGPSLATTVNITNRAVTIQWTNTSTCYERLRYIILLYKPDNTTDLLVIDKDSDTYTFNDLSPGTTYTAEIYTDYDSEPEVTRSPIPLEHAFTTASFCSHLQPCYPGHCKSDIDECICSNGFSGSTCLQFNEMHSPSLQRSAATFSFVDLSTNIVKYTYQVNSTEHNLTWANQEMFNSRIFVLEASFDGNLTFGSLPRYPNYLNKSEFGIVEGHIQFTHTFQSTVKNKTVLQCTDPSEESPIPELHCNIQLLNASQLSSGDIMTLEFMAHSGGNRKLINFADNEITGIEFYQGQSVQQSMEFRFDFDIPVHCTQILSCEDNPMNLENDITKTPIKANWSGWDDKISGIHKFTFEIWKLDYVLDKDGLMEPQITNMTNPKPLFLKEILPESDFITNLQFTPDMSGVYSCILEINDNANNSEYVRRIVIYDKTSDVSVNESRRLLVSSAEVETNYTWQTVYIPTGISIINVTWEGLFLNQLHSDGHFLANVLYYEPRLSDNILRHGYKRILPEFDDNEGTRTLDAIDNINGIARFELVYEVVGSKKSQTPATGWFEILPLMESTSVQMTSGSVSDGDILQIWIRASDVMGNHQTQTSLLYFDQSGPDNFVNEIQYNIEDGGTVFSTRFSLIFQDLHSGIENISIEIVLNETDEIKYRTYNDSFSVTKVYCSSTPECYCIPKGQCFMRSVNFEINNCDLGVPLALLNEGTFYLSVKSVNTASLQTASIFQVGEVKLFKGIDEYASPSAIFVVNKTNSQITIMWTNKPTCYQRHGFIILFSKPDNSSQTLNVDANSTLYTFDGLFPGSNYSVDIYTQYGNGTHQTMSLQPRSVTVTTDQFCSHLQPCYPGNCKIDSDGCLCSNGFSGATCLQIDEVYRSELLRINSTLTRMDTTTWNEISSILVNATNNLTWTNQDKFDILELHMDAVFHTNSTIGYSPSFPNYIKSARVGIAQGNVQFMHKTLIEGDNVTVVSCSDISGLNPVDEMNCVIRLERQFNLNSGETFLITFNAQSGGNRHLINIGDGTDAGIEYYIGSYVTQNLEYRFDFDVPVHCTQNTICGRTSMQLIPDVTTTKFRPSWSGWMDALSGVYKYTFEVWKMEYVQSEDGLREPLITNSSNPEPLFLSEIMEDNIVFPDYQPTEAGVYSCILEINDKANNSEYVRRIVIYDKVSDVELNSTGRFYVSSASSSTNFTWQTSYNSEASTGVEIQWQGLFSNFLHEQQHFLSKVLNYQPRLSDNIKRNNYKRILPRYDDKDGDRTTSSISNVHGIVRFEIVHEKVTKQKSDFPSTGWVTVVPFAENSTFQISQDTIGDGDSRQVWIRAFDIMNNSKSDTTMVHFDRSGPVNHLTGTNFNANGQYKFTSRFTIITEDLHSGCTNVSIQLKLENSDDIKYQTEEGVEIKTNAQCDTIPDCYCVPMGLCFLRKIEFDVNSCLLAVSSELLDNGKYILIVASSNTAGLNTTSVFEIDVKDIVGINEYSSPSSVSFQNKTKTAVTLQWINTPTCYEPNRYIIYLLQPNNSTREFEISPNETTFTITGLSSGVSYSIEMYTEYGNQSFTVRSAEPVYLQFDTSDPEEESSSLNLVPIIVGSVIGFILLVIIAILAIVYFLKRRHRNLCVGPISEPDVINNAAKAPMIKKSPTIKRKLSISALSIPESPSLEKANKRLQTNIFDISLPKGRAKTLPPLPPLSSTIQKQPL